MDIKIILLLLPLFLHFSFFYEMFLNHFTTYFNVFTMSTDHRSSSEPEK